MKNKISIDDLVRQHVVKGEEPHNLGAWANMERMLDGKNPYQEKEEEKKRPWLFLLLGLLVCSTAVIGSYYYFNSAEYGQNQLAQLPSENNFGLKNRNNQSPTNNNEILVFDDDTEPNSSNQQESNFNARESADSDNEYANALASNTTNTASLSKPAFTNNSSSNNFQARNNDLRNSGLNETPLLEKTPINQDPSKGNNEKQSLARTSQSNKNKSKDNAQFLSNNEPGKKLNTIVAQNNSSVSEKNETIAPTIQEKYLDTTKFTKITKRLTKQNGKTQYVNDSMKFKVVEEKVREIVNPRYVALSQEQEQAAQRKTAIASASKKLSKPSMAAMSQKEAVSQINQSNKAQNAQNAQQATITETATAANSVSSKEKRSFFSVFKKTAQKLNQKAINVAHTRFPIYTGMFAGVNAAVINSPHNFGGFQAGLTAMTPLSRLFTLRTEARFIHKNNSGYTIKDGRMDLLSTTVDSSSIFKTKIYNYQMDSVSNSYNLQNFYTLQMPIIVSANIRKFNAYAGINLNYGFRLNVKGSQRTSPHTIIDTVPSSMMYTQRSSSELKFTNDDFGSRFGIGYTVGGAYNFNPNLYLDLRMSNPVWDNTKGAAKQEISDVFFKIPSFQLSLGYRFRKYKSE